MSEPNQYKFPSWNPAIHRVKSMEYYYKHKTRILESKKELTTCQTCNKTVQKHYLRRHQTTQKCIKKNSNFVMTLSGNTGNGISSNFLKNVIEAIETNKT